MAITKLTNTQIQNLVNLAYAEMTGETGVDETLDLSAFCDNGAKEIGDKREQFLGKLLGVTAKTWFTDTSYRSEFDDPYMEDSDRFGAIVQMIHVEVPDVKENSAWQTFQSGVTSIGTYTLYLPVVDNQLYAKSTSWALPISFTNEQLDPAFKNAGELSRFVAYVYMMIDNALAQHELDMSYANRNNFMAQKIYADSQLESGVHVVDLVAKYVADRGITEAFSVEKFMTSQDALLYAIEQINLYIGYMKKQTRLFNIGEKLRFVPNDRLVVELLNYFEQRVAVMAQSDVYHKELVALPNHYTVPAWQSMEDLSFDGVSSINVKVADLENASTTHTVEKGGIIGFVADKWAIAHTIKGQRVGTQYFSIEDVTHTEYQFRDQYMNNLTMPAIVFAVSDYTPA